MSVSVTNPVVSGPRVWRASGFRGYSSGSSPVGVGTPINVH